MALMTLFWILVTSVSVFAVMGALGIWGIYLAYTQGEEFQVEALERKHGLSDDSG